MNKKWYTMLSFVMLVCMTMFAQEQKIVAAVVPFDSKGVPQEEVDVVYQMFMSEFVRTGKYSVVDKSNVDRIKSQQNFQLSDWSNNEKLAQLGKALNANVIVTGQAMKFRTQVMFIMQILDVSSAKIISSSNAQVNDVAELFSKFPAMCRELTKNTAKPRDTVAIVPFDFSSSEVPQEEVDVIYQMFLSDFTRTGKYFVVDKGSFDRIKSQQNFQLSDWSNNEKVAQLGKALNANIIVTGQAMKFRTQVMFIMQILDVSSAKIISSSDERVNDVIELFGKFPAMCLELANSASTPQGAAAKKYAVGDVGLGGGYVFYYSERGFLVYDSDYTSPAICHYLECSPTELGVMAWCPCGNAKWCDVNTEDGVGVGMLNTKHIISYSHAQSLTTSNCAAYACSRYSTGTTKEGDWYLPSLFELTLMYENLRKSGKIDNNAWHWSSLQGHSNEAWDKRFSDGAMHSYNDTNKYNKGCVRAIRAF